MNAAIWSSSKPSPRRSSYCRSVGALERGRFESPARDPQSIVSRPGKTKALEGKCRSQQICRLCLRLLPESEPEVPADKPSTWHRRYVLGVALLPPAAPPTHHNAAARHWHRVLYPHLSSIVEATKTPLLPWSDCSPSQATWLRAPKAAPVPNQPASVLRPLRSRMSIAAMYGSQSQGDINGRGGERR